MCTVKKGPLIFRFDFLTTSNVYVWAYIYIYIYIHIYYYNIILIILYYIFFKEKLCVIVREILHALYLLQLLKIYRSIITFTISFSAFF